MATLGERIDAALDARGWTQADALRESRDRGYGITSSMLSKWIGDKAKPSADQTVALCRLLGISAHWLLLDEGGMNPPGQAVLEPYVQARLEVSAELRRQIRQGIDTALTAPAAGQPVPGAGEPPNVPRDAPKLMPKKVTEPRVLPLRRKRGGKGKG